MTNNVRWWAVPGVFGLAWAAWAFLAQDGPQRLNADVEVPFELANHHIVVPVTVNASRPLSFIFDTGDKDAIIDAARARELQLDAGREIPLTGAGSGSLRAFVASGARFSLPSLPGFSQPIALAVPLDRLPPKLGHAVDGIIGTAFINAFVVEVDYRRRVLVLHDAETFTYRGAGAAVPLRFNDQAHPVVEGAVTYLGQEYAGPFLLDLGASSALVLHTPFVAAHGAPSTGMPVVGTGGATGDTRGLVGRVSSLRLGSMVMPGPVTLFSSDQTGAFARPDVIGTIGARAMERFRVFLDYRHRRVIFEPVVPLNAPFLQSTCGCALAAEGPRFRMFRVEAVADGWPAAAAGLQAGDVIAAVDGRDTTDMTLDDLLKLFEAPVARHLLIQRGASRLTATLVPRPL